MTRLLITKLYDEAIIPKRQTTGASGLDLHVYCPESDYEIPPALVRQTMWTNNDIVRTPAVLVRTGVAVEVPRGYEGQIRPRSSARKLGLDVVFGTIDSDYRGEVHVQVANLSGEWLHLTHGQRIAQLVIAPVEMCDVVVVEGLSETDRGSGGFGSTGQ